MGRSNAIAVLFTRSDPARPDLNCGMRLAVFQSVAIVDPMHPRPIVDSRAVSACRNSHGVQRDHARTANMNTLAQAEERRIGLKNNTPCVSPAPIQQFTITWL
jgi:hypothetical protein